MNKRTMLKFIFASLFFSETAFGEYRVYQYYIRSKIKNINPPTATLVTSTLDPVSYAAYNGGKDSIEVNLLRSWLCYGNTSKQSVCTLSNGEELNEGGAL